MTAELTRSEASSTSTLAMWKTHRFPTDTPSMNITNDTGVLLTASMLGQCVPVQDGIWHRLPNGRYRRL